ncbi:MAG TPA: ubiquinone-dependent pyruvate dehydrogenase, partial [Zunongwangia profunda]|nr:ubiquinone-dependent pyruvate dehydrogenase [Zunongwangia profunda]
AMNIHSWVVEDPKNIQQALQEAFDHDGPAVVNIFTDPDALAMPPEINFEQIKGFAKTMGKMMLNGRTAEVIDTAKSDMKYLKEIF